MSGGLAAHQDVGEVTFTGSTEESGWGRELEPEGVENYLEKKSVFVQY